MASSKRRLTVTLSIEVESAVTGATIKDLVDRLEKALPDLVIDSIYQSTWPVSPSPNEVL